MRSEIARLTRLFDQAVRTSALNNPDMYSGDSTNTFNNVGLRAKPIQPAPAGPQRMRHRRLHFRRPQTVCGSGSRSKPGNGGPEPAGKEEAHEVDHGVERFQRWLRLLMIRRPRILGLRRL